MRQYDALQREVGAWSQLNFHDQESPHFVLKMEPFPDGWKVGDDMPPTLVAMGSLAPLMGLTEELGELFAACHPFDVEDALGDIFIYLCDYAAREGFTLPVGRHLTFELEPIVHADVMTGLVIWLGKLYHGTLKRHQGIRGFDNDETFIAHRNYCTAMIIAHMQKLSAEALDKSLLQVVNRTWCNIVAKRDWKKAPADGGGHDHHDN